MSFHVSTHLGRDERVGQVDGKFEVLTIPVSDVDRSKAFCQRQVEGCRHRRPLNGLDIAKLRRRQAVQARCLQNKCVVIQKESLCKNHRWEREAGSGREKRPVQPSFSCMGHLPMHRDSVA